MTLFFDRNGKRMSMMQWAKAWEDPGYRVLGSHTIGNLWVSTVWLGIDHDVSNLFMDPPAPPLIFESMIFEVPEGDEHWHSLEMRRYRTEKEAMVGHTELVNMANMLVDIEKEVMVNPLYEEARASVALDGETHSAEEVIDDGVERGADRDGMDFDVEKEVMGDES